MDRAWLRYAQTLRYQDPAGFLVKLRQLEGRVARSDLPETVRQLRTNKLKPWRELREGALFCQGMSKRIGQTVYLAKGESQDYDFIACWVVDEQQHLAPVQLKEVVPHDRNPKTSLQAIVDALPAKYVASSQLTVAIHLNQQVRFEPSELVVPPLNIAALWVFAAIEPTQTHWALWGNFTEESPFGTTYEYPAA